MLIFKQVTKKYALTIKNPDFYFPILKIRGNKLLLKMPKIPDQRQVCKSN
jgi:hypothetical protein